mgnify:CR=1 FL=1
MQSVESMDDGAGFGAARWAWHLSLEGLFEEYQVKDFGGDEELGDDRMLLEVSRQARQLPREQLCEDGLLRAQPEERW